MMGGLRGPGGPGRGGPPAGRPSGGGEAPASGRRSLVLVPRLLWAAVRCAPLASATLLAGAVTGGIVAALELVVVQRLVDALSAALTLPAQGALATDVGDASGTLLFDVGARSWHRGVCEKLGIDPALLPPSHESASVIGTVTVWAARETGLAEGTPVVAGSGDNMTSAVGSGVVERGIVAGALGTSGVIIAH